MRIMRTVGRAFAAARAPTWLAPCLFGMLQLVLFGGPVAAVADSKATLAMNRVVSNCDDDGPGSLRAVVSQAVNGDTIDLTQLSCSTIRLTNGTITLPQDDLVLVGPGRFALAIDGGAEQEHHNRVLTHTGHGTLSVSGMTLKNAAPIGTYGGCVDSFGNVSLVDALLSGCVVTSFGGSPVMGGAVYAGGNIQLVDTTVRDNSAVAVGGANAKGGGLYAQGDLDLEASYVGLNAATAFESRAMGGGIYVTGGLTMRESQVVGNRATNPFLQDGQSYGGGLVIQGNFLISDSTIANNFAGQRGGLYSFATIHTGERIIANSTISSNHSLRSPAGIYMLGTLQMFSSTVAFNAADGIASSDSAGIMAFDHVDIQSSIVANNMNQGQPSDMDATLITGANNIVYAPAAVTVPADTLVGVDPLLGALTNHGGSTPTQPLLENSPALDAGNNAGGFDYDQRGPGFARLVGNQADIGAFESRPSLMAITPDAIDFGSVPVGVVSAPITVAVNNTGDARVAVSFVEAANPPFIRSGGSCGAAPFMLVANASCTLTYYFAPTTPGGTTRALTMVSNAGTEVLALAGIGVADDVIFAAGFDAR